MKTFFPKHPVMILLLLFALTCTDTGLAQAHSTKGRIKIPLSKETLTVEDVAYFVESYVHHHFYKDRFEKSKNRFYVKEFTGVDQNGRQADIRFLVLDVKVNSDFPDKMSISQEEDNTWRFQPENGTSIEMYTYVPKWGYYYERYILSAGAGGIVLATALLFFLRLRKRQKGVSTC